MSEDVKIKQVTRKILGVLEEHMHHDGFNWFWEGTKFRQASLAERRELREFMEAWIRKKKSR